MSRLGIALVAAALPVPAAAHDAFGDLGPFYASFLHPLADPLQAALVVGTAAFLAGRPVETVRVALPVFLLATLLAQLLAGVRADIAAAPLLVAFVLVAIGAVALLPEHWSPLWMVIAVVAVSGIFVGLAPGPLPPKGALQPLAGGALGIAVSTTLAWAGIDTLSRRLSQIAPAVAGSWVAAVGLIAGAFAFAPPEDRTGAEAVAAELEADISEASDP
jgi:hypothetical protein